MDSLLPCAEGPDGSDKKVQSNETAGVGTTKRKELHGTTHVRALSGSWRDNPDGAVFHTYKITFVSDIAGEQYPGFVLLTELKQDDDVANAKVDLYLLDKMVKSSVTPSGELKLGADQIQRAMRFHELLFNGLFGKLFLGSKASGTQREFLLQKDNSVLWSPSYMYLTLPLESLNSVDHDSWEINWKWIDSCVFVVEFMKTSSWLSAEQCEGKTRSAAVGPTSVEENCNGMDIIHLANSSFSRNNLKDTVLMAIHTGRIYYVADVIADSSAESPFDGNDGKSKYSSFADYFNKKYGIVLLYPGQPLLLLKQTHNPFNLLSDSEVGAIRRKMANDDKVAAAEKLGNHVHMPPELVVSIDMPVSVLRAFYLIPSLMHRMESLMLACQLREDIAFNSSNPRIMPSSLILEALTTLRCCEDFSSERLELLGDSVLKYALSCHLFLKYPQKHEGKLSSQRQRAVCNANLHVLGTNRRLQEYIRDSAFEPRRWVAPGQLSVHPVPCSHGIDTSEVPLDSRYQTTDENTVLGKNCDRGHRWMVSKGIADCVEALIGAYYVGGGLTAALHVMKWLGLEAELEPSSVDKVINLASDRSHTQKADEITTLESKLGYAFTTKGLLLEALTHATGQGGAGYCYERLEFLGDAVLDVIITWYLYQTHKGIDPGELTDLRSASVNNESFAQAAVRQNLHLHLQHSSGSLSDQITEYAKLVMEAEDPKALQGRQCPKALGDLVESIAGAILIDTKLSVEEVWRIFEPLLSPIASPENLDLPPFRELNELCDSRGYFFKETFMSEKDGVVVELKLQLEDVLLIGEGTGKTKKAARGQAALHLLGELEKRGISYARFGSKGGKKRELQQTAVSTLTAKKKRKGSKLSVRNTAGVGPVVAGAPPVIGAINMEKGGPRTTLYELCKQVQWPMPSFEHTEEKSRSPIEFGQGGQGLTAMCRRFRCTYRILALWRLPGSKELIRRALRILLR